MSQKIKYLYQHKQISEILAQGFAKICQQSPKFPISYLAGYLKNHNIKIRQRSNLIDKIESNQQINKQLQKAQLLLKQQQTQSHQKHVLIQKQQQHFMQKIKLCQKHQQILDQFCNYITNKFSLTATYIGELQYQTKIVNLELQDGDEAHLELEKEKVIKFKYSNQTQKKIVIGKIYPQDTVVGRLFSQITNTEENNANQQENNQENQQQQQQQKQKIPKNQVYFPSVVGNQQLKFFRFPKLGAYYAISLSIKSYLTQKLFDDNTVKVQTYKKLLNQYQKQMQQKQTKFKQQYDQKVNSGTDEKQLQEIQKQFQREKSQIKKPQLQSFDFIQRKIVICFDTLGLDREINEQQRKKIRQFVYILKQSWQTRQRSQLSHDIDLQLKLLKPQIQQQSQNINYQQQFNQLIQQQQKQIPSHEQVQKVKQNQKLFQLQSNTIRLQKVKEYLIDQKYTHFWDHLLELNVIKYGQIFKQFLIIMGYKKDKFIIKGTNKLDWKKMKILLKNDKQKIFDNLVGISPRGNKPQFIQLYAKCIRIQKNIQSLDPVTVSSYNIYLAFLLRFVKIYIKTRFQDKQFRLSKIQSQRQNRELKIKQSQQKEIQKKQKLQSHKAQLQQKGQLQTFDQQAWNLQFDQENPPVEIPPKVYDQFDMDLEDQRPKTMKNIDNVQEEGVEEQAQQQENNQVQAAE